MKPRRRFHGEIALMLGLATNACAVAFFAKSDLGMSTLSLASFVMHGIFPTLTLGTWSYIIQCALILVLVALIRRVSPGYIFSFCLAILYGLLIDLFSFLIAGLPTSLPARVIYYLIGFSGLSMGTAFLIQSEMPILPFDTFMREISVHFRISYRRLRTWFDLSTVVVSAVLGWWRLGSFVGIGVGTLLNALFIGQAVSRVARFLDGRFQFEPRFAWFSRLR
ncbi:MAG: DUF6198 family protein [Rectinemataceae bacterium]|nr:DUF6198 family protein [Rectinemataceae bacterium]